MDIVDKETRSGYRGGSGYHDCMDVVETGIAVPVVAEGVDEAEVQMPEQDHCGESCRVAVLVGRMRQLMADQFVNPSQKAGRAELEGSCLL